MHQFPRDIVLRPCNGDPFRIHGFLLCEVDTDSTGNATIGERHVFRLYVSMPPWNAGPHATDTAWLEIAFFDGIESEPTVDVVPVPTLDSLDRAIRQHWPTGTTSQNQGALQRRYDDRSQRFRYEACRLFYCGPSFVGSVLWEAIGTLLNDNCQSQELTTDEAITDALMATNGIVNRVRILRDVAQFIEDLPTEQKRACIDKAVGKSRLHRRVFMRRHAGED